MHNTYFLLRHGQSAANLAGVILSDPKEGERADYRLTPLGEQQVRTSVTDAKERGELGSNTIIITSPFSRCRQTAEIAKEILKIEANPIIDVRLRERWFGDWEKTFLENYKKVWAADKLDPSHTIAHVESSQDVQVRSLALIAEIEAKYAGETILLVSHGDTIQILLTGLKHESAAYHRDIPHFETGELRKVIT